MTFAVVSADVKRNYCIESQCIHRITIRHLLPQTLTLKCCINWSGVPVDLKVTGWLPDYKKRNCKVKWRLNHGASLLLMQNLQGNCLVQMLCIKSLLSFRY